VSVACRLGVIYLAVAALTFAQPSLPEIWTNKMAGTIYRLTVKGQRFRAEKIFSPQFAAQAADGAFVRCDYTPQGDAWAGKCESRLPFETSKNHVKWCKFNFTSKIILFTPGRIEGESDVWETEDVEVNKCELRKSHRQHFIWVPKE